MDLVLIMEHLQFFARSRRRRVDPLHLVVQSIAQDQAVGQGESSRFHGVPLAVVVVSYALGEVLGYHRFAVRPHMGCVQGLGLVRPMGGEWGRPKERGIRDGRPGITSDVVLQWVGT